MPQRASAAISFYYCLSRLGRRLLGDAVQRDKHGPSYGRPLAGSIICILGRSQVVLYGDKSFHTKFRPDLGEVPQLHSRIKLLTRSLSLSFSYNAGILFHSKKKNSPISFSNLRLSPYDRITSQINLCNVVRNRTWLVRILFSYLVPYNPFNSSCKTSWNFCRL